MSANRYEYFQHAEQLFTSDLESFLNFTRDIEQVGLSRRIKSELYFLRGEAFFSLANYDAASIAYQKAEALDYSNDFIKSFKLFDSPSSEVTSNNVKEIEYLQRIRETQSESSIFDCSLM